MCNKRNSQEDLIIMTYDFMTYYDLYTSIFQNKIQEQFYKIFSQLQARIYVCSRYNTDMKLSVLESLKRVDANKTLQI